MRVVAGELLASSSGVKFLLNDSAIAFFPMEVQHRDFKIPGLSYEDDHLGNALAGMIFSDRIEIRYHRAFSDERVKCIWNAVLQLEETAALKSRTVLYQRRPIR